MPAAMDCTEVFLEVGFKIAGRYRIKSFRDSGAAGWMVRARDENTEQDVAVKVIDSKLIQSDQERNQFLSVCKKARKVDHVNVARLYEEGREGNVVYYVMQYLEGLRFEELSICDLRKSRCLSTAKYCRSLISSPMV